MDHSYPLEWSAAALSFRITRSSTKPKARPLRGLSEAPRAPFRHLLWSLGADMLPLAGVPFQWATAIISTPKPRSDRSGPTLFHRRLIPVVSYGEMTVANRSKARSRPNFDHAMVT